MVVAIVFVNHLATHEKIPILHVNLIILLNKHIITFLLINLITFQFCSGFSFSSLFFSPFYLFYGGNNFLYLYLPPKNDSSSYFFFIFSYIWQMLHFNRKSEY